MKAQLDGFAVRAHARFLLRTAIVYVGKDFAGQGVVRELSRAGCRIVGNYPVTCGETLWLQISHPTDPDECFIEQARVRWVRGFEFGVAFRFLEAGAGDRMHHLLDELLSSWSYSALALQS